MAQQPMRAKIHCTQISIYGMRCISRCSNQATASVPYHDAQTLVHRPAAERPHLHHLQELHHPGATGPPLRQGQHGPRGEWGKLDIFFFHTWNSDLVGVSFNIS
ncbi:hypothetical protein TNCV_1594951 [Trichonephila clavipes]|nr:hypothetical protein TNCV_1594951 [Trichonephila clavipes]